MSNTTQNETHTVCDERLAREGGKATCCYCRPHDGCTLGNKKTNTPKPIHEYKDRVPNFGKALEKEYPPVEATTTQNWEKRFDERFPCRHHVSQCDGDCNKKIKDFIRREIADAKINAIKDVLKKYTNAFSNL